MGRYIVVTEYVRQLRWCEKRGWSDPFYEKGFWYAFPPGTVIPYRIPTKIQELRAWFFSK